MEKIKPPLPEIIFETIERVETDLKKYICDTLIVNGQNRILVTIQRKGNIIIEHLKKDDIIKKKFNETFLDTITSDDLLQSCEYHNKKIIIFDDSVDEGHKIKDFFDEYRHIINLSEEDFLIYREKNIKVGAFLVNKNNLKKIINERLIDEELIGKSEHGVNFVKNILDIITYIIHLGDIIDSDHLIIKGNFKEPVTYSKIFDILESTNGRLYEPDFNFHHPDKKKITLYDLPYLKWVDVNQLNIKDEKFQCLIRFVFDVIQINKELYVTNFLLAPVINPKIKIGYPKNCTKFEPKLCKINQTNEYCVDCNLYPLITKVLHCFWTEWYNNIEKNKITISDLEISWNQMNNKYKKFDENFCSSTYLEKIIFK